MMNFITHHGLIICDVDGTLFDTIDVNFQAYKKAMEFTGYDLKRDVYIEYMFGKFYLDYLPILLPWAGRDVYEEIHDKKKSYYKECLQYAKINRHLFNILETMASDYHITIVSNACRENTEDILKYSGKENLFEEIMTQEDYERKKPDPQGFLMMMDKLNISPSCTLIFEDSDVGLQAAIASGAAVMKVVKGFDRI